MNEVGQLVVEHHTSCSASLSQVAEPEVITKNLSQNKLYFTSVVAKL
jgi:hypothetical protein